MGHVFRARDVRLNRDVALKTLPDTWAADPQRLARFEREARILASLNHPNIAALYEVFEAEGQRVLVMELVEGPTLADRVKASSLSCETGEAGLGDQELLSLVRRLVRTEGGSR